MNDEMLSPDVSDPSMQGSSPVCPKCHKGTMKRSNFRTGSVDKPKADVQVCSHCGHRIEQQPPQQ